MAFNVKVGSWLPAKGVFIKVSGSWASAKAVYARVNGSWVKVWSSMTFTQVANMPTARQLSGVGSLDGNTWYVNGGRNSGGTVLATNEEYTASTNSWATKAGMYSAKYGHSCISANGLIYAVGGFPGNLIQSFNPATNTWFNVVASSNLTQWDGVSVQYRSSDNNIYIAGGSPYAVSTNIFQRYDLNANLFTQLSNMPVERHMAASGIVGNDMYVMGGANTQSGSILASSYKYVASSNTWVPIAQSSGSGFSQAVQVGTKFYCFYWGICEVYDASTNTWASTSGLNPNGVNDASRGAYPGKHLFAGGTNYWNIAYMFNAA